MITTERLDLDPMTLEELKSLKSKGYSFLDEIILGAIDTKIRNMEQVPEEVRIYYTYFGIREKETDHLIGLLGMKGLPDESGMVELGYTLATEERKKGYMKEAMEGMLDFMFEDPLIQGAVLYIRPENGASISLARSCDFDHEGEYKEYQVYTYLF